MHNMLIVTLMIVSFMMINPPTFASEAKEVAAVEQTQPAVDAEELDEEEDEEEEVSN